MGADACFDADGARSVAVLFGDTKVLQSSPGEHLTSVSSAPVFNDIFVVLIYVIYIYSIIFYFFTGVPVHNRSQGGASAP